MQKNQRSSLIKTIPLNLLHPDNNWKKEKLVTLRRCKNCNHWTKTSYIELRPNSGELVEASRCCGAEVKKERYVQKNSNN